MIRHDRTLPDSRPDARRCGYALVVRGPDGQPRVERFDNVAAYKARLMGLESSEIDSVSIEEIVEMLDA